MSLFCKAVLMGLLASTPAAGYACALPANPDVAIIDAGTGGIAAARALIQRGLEVLVIEAADPVGGRACIESAVSLPPYAALCAGAHLSGERAAAEVAARLAVTGACTACDARGRQRTRLIGESE